MKQVILLHGAIGCSIQLNPLAEVLKQKGYQTLTFNFSGHGKSPFKADFGISQFANELKAFVQDHNLNKPAIFGYSMGGYVALYLAKQHPELLGKIITLGTKFKWTKEIAEKEIQNLNPEIIEQKVPNFAENLKQMHGEDWKVLLQRTAHMMTGLGQKNALELNNYVQIKNKILLGLADKDQMVSEEETTEVSKKLPNATMFRLANSKHPIETADLPMLTEIICNFLDQD